MTGLRFARLLVFAFAFAVLFHGGARADCRHTNVGLGRVLDRADLQQTLDYCLNESGHTEERRQMQACNSLVRYACTPSRGSQLSTEDREILVWAYTVRASALLNLGHTDAALRDLDDAVLLDRNNARLLTQRCRVRATANRELDIALADCNAALEAEPGAMYASGARGLAYLRRGESDAAMADYARVIVAEPNCASALYGRAVAQARLGNAAAAQADAAAAVGLDDNIDDRFAAMGLAP